jgi:hypothetical protein
LKIPEKMFKKLQQVSLPRLVVASGRLSVVSKPAHCPESVTILAIFQKTLQKVCIFTAGCEEGKK